MENYGGEIMKAVKEFDTRCGSVIGQVCLYVALIREKIFWGRLAISVTNKYISEHCLRKVLFVLKTWIIVGDRQ